jgi:FkbM family methyltransferase
LTGPKTRALARRAAELLGRAWWLARLGTDRRASTKIALVTLSMPIKSRIPALAQRLVRLRMRLSGNELELWLSDHSELLVIEEIWRRGEYASAVPFAREATTILDLGANVGLSALWFRGLNPDARIVAVEPDPRTLAKLVRNVAHDPRIEPVGVAIAPHSGTVGLESSRDSWTSRLAGGGEHRIEVKGETLDELVERLSLDPLDLVKMDIEGMEWSVLESSSCLRQPRLVIGELHPDVGPTDAGAFLDAVAARWGLVVRPAITARHFVFERPTLVS